jgi:hypothetical protein
MRLTAFASIVLLSLTACARSSPMSPELEGMIADVVAETGIDVRIVWHTAVRARISKIDGANVCSPGAQADVKRLQMAIEAHPGNYITVGPAGASAAYPEARRRFQFDLGWLYETGQIEDECPRILVSVPEYLGR